MLSRRSFSSVLAFNFNNEMDMEDASLLCAVDDRAFATRLIVSRSEGKSLGVRVLKAFRRMLTENCVVNDSGIFPIESPRGSNIKENLRQFLASHKQRDLQGNF